MKLSAWLLASGLIAALSVSCKKKESEVPQPPQITTPVEEAPKPILDDSEAPAEKPSTPVEEDMPDEEEPSAPDNEPAPNPGN